ncbi:MntP/YtaF family protein [Cohnella sp. JJ-181]|uniref:MntP/YtaF family protein n=1 Tax=Cohnella rhizoplanae TaxID=2974897 RepID=UPI0022FFA400|nr:MntP/YtaF family protein [Cohnella sp. JJ-181]CAI6077885.1 putative sporulation protein YtaF [Cohnella sp. JJ-181]
MLAHSASLLFLAFAVSLDGFGVGITYGLRKIRIPLPSIAIIAACSGAVILVSMLVGSVIARWLSPYGAKAVGAAILIGIGTWALVQFARNRRSETDTEKAPVVGGHRDEGTVAETGAAGGTRSASAGGSASGLSRPGIEGNASAPEADGAVPMLTLELRVFGLIVQILRTPSVADVDRSGIITSGEALLLGLALSLDAFGAGIGAALVGFPAAPTAILISAASGIFLWVGMRVGFLAAGMRWAQRLSVLPGIILIAMGIFKLMQAS